MGHDEHDDSTEHDGNPLGLLIATATAVATATVAATIATAAVADVAPTIAAVAPTVPVAPVTGAAAAAHVAGHPDAVSAWLRTLLALSLCRSSAAPYEYDNAHDMPSTTAARNPNARVASVMAEV